MNEIATSTHENPIHQVYPPNANMSRDELKTAVTALWREFSACEIANGLGRGLTKNAVIGLIHRAGLSGCEKIQKQNTSTKTKASRRVASKATPKATEQAEPPRPASAPKAAISHISLVSHQQQTTPEGLTLLDLRSNQCHYTLNKKINGLTAYCAQPTNGIESHYCHHHSAIMYQPHSSLERKERHSLRSLLASCQ